MTARRGTRDALRMAPPRTPGGRAKDRAMIYRTLSVLFRPPAFPPADLAQALRVARPWLSIRRTYPEVGAKAWTPEIIDVEGRSLQNLSEEYVRLFAGPGAPLKPYESLWRGSPETISPLTVAVCRAYEESGFALAAGWHDLPDHVACELEYMASLCIGESESGARRDRGAAAESADRQGTFLRDHVGRWSPAFFTEVARTSGIPLYRVAARAGALFIALDEGRHPVRRPVPGDGDDRSSGFREVITAAGTPEVGR